MDYVVVKSIKCALLWCNLFIVGVYDCRFIAMSSCGVILRVGHTLTECTLSTPFCRRLVYSSDNFV